MWSGGRLPTSLSAFPLCDLALRGSSHMERRLGLPSAAVLVVANMIGAGVFTTSGFALADLHRRDIVLLAWLVGGLLAVCGH